MAWVASATWGYLEVPQTRQEATSTYKPVTRRPENISEAGYECVCLNARRIVNKKNEFNIVVKDSEPHMISKTNYGPTKTPDAELGLMLN